MKNNYYFLRGNILKRKRNATLSKMVILSFLSKITGSDSEIARNRYLPCIQNQNQTAVTYGWRVATRNVRQPLFLKSQSSKNVPILRKNVLNKYRFLKAKGKTKSKQVLLCVCQRSFCQNDVLIFFGVIGHFIQTNINNQKLLMAPYSPQYIP